MPQLSERRGHPLAALLAGAAVVLAVALICLAWSRSERAAQGVKLSLRDAAPTLPHLPPQGPRLPDAPIPMPR